MDLLVDGLGVAGMLTSAVIFQQKARKRMLIWKLISDLFWVAHYLALGAYSGAAVMFVSVLRSVLLLRVENPGKGWLAAFLTISLVLSILAWKNIFSLLALACSFCSIIAFWMDSPKLTRMITIPASGAYLVYCVSCGSIEGSVSEAFGVISAIVGVFRLDIKKKKQ